MNDGFSRFIEKCGPGFPITTYLPKKDWDLVTKLAGSLQTSKRSKAAVAASIQASKGKKGEGKGDGKGQHGCIKIQEKRLDVDLWTCAGENYGGSHFPLCAFTHNVGRRSPQKLEQRMQRAYEKKVRAVGQKAGAARAAGKVRALRPRRITVRGGRGMRRGGRTLLRPIRTTVRGGRGMVRGD